MSGTVTDERTLATRLRLAVMRLNRRLRAQRSDEITLTQLAALATLNRYGPMGAGELATLERVQPPSMSRVIARLEESGLVVRKPHDTDGRAAVIEITTAGTAQVDSEIAAREAWLEARLAELTAEQRDVLCRATEIIDGMAGH